MYVILWEFEVKAEHAALFLAIYSAEGEWARLFSQAPGYLGTELLSSSAAPLRFITVDRWQRAEDFHEFRRQFDEAYKALDLRCQGLTLSERHLGSYISE